MAQASPTTKTEMHITGDISGQVAIGNNILQIKTGDIYGGIVNIIPPEQKPRSWPRSTPVFQRPRPFPGLLDRATEIDVADATSRSALPLEFCGQAGLGKTSLLRHLAYRFSDTPFPDGIVYLRVCRQPVDDLLQSFFDTFYECDASFKPTEGQIQSALQGKQALVLLDDVELPRDEVEALMNKMPGCTFILASPERCLWGEGRVVILQGLAPHDALTLVERELERPLAPEDRLAVQSLCAALDGHPLRILQAASLARDEGYALANVARQVRTASPDKALAKQILKSLPEPSKRVLAALVVFDGASLAIEHLAALTGLSNLESIVETLFRRGLVQAHSPRYSLTGALRQDLRQTLDWEPWAEHALTYFAEWAERNQSVPNRLAQEANAILQILAWAVQAEHWQGVLRLGRAVEGALALSKQWGVWHQVLEWLLQAARALGDRAIQAWALHQIGTRTLCLEKISLARSFLARALRLRESLGDPMGAAVTRHNLNLIIAPPPPPPESSGPPTSPPGGATLSIVSSLPNQVIALLSVLIVTIGAVATIVLPKVISPIITPTATSAHVTPTFTVIPMHTPTFTPMPTATNMPLPTYTSIPTSTSWPCGNPPPNWQLYTVQHGDTLYSLARSRGTTAEWAMFYNCLTSPNLWVGQQIYLPTLPPTDTPTLTPTFTPTPDLTPPLPPTLLSPENEAEIACPADPANVTLRWSPVTDPSGIAGYFGQLEATIYETPRQATPAPVNFGPVQDTTFQAWLDCGWAYRWQVQAMDNAGNVSNWSQERSFFVAPIDVSPPAPPELLYPEEDIHIPCALGREEQPIHFRWTVVYDPSGIQNYEIYLKAVERTAFIYTSLSQVSNKNVLVPCEEWYRWMVRAIDGAGNIGPWSEEGSFSVAPSDTTPPPVPDPIEPGSSSENEPLAIQCEQQVVLRWSAVSDISGIKDYTVELESYDSKEWINVQVFVTPETSTDVRRWTAWPRDYRWRVQAQDNAGKVSEFSNWMYFWCPPPEG